MLQNNKGFSLVELMIVVAIIGILSAVAVPQFQKFQRKAKQSEAKSNLAGLYTSQKIFRIEHNTYYNNLIALGFLPEGAYQYRIGDLSTASTVTKPFSLNGISQYVNVNIMFETHNICRRTFSEKLSGDIAGYGTQCVVVGDLCATSLFPPGAGVNPATFLMGACGQLGGATEDTWTMSHTKELINVKNGAL